MKTFFYAGLAVAIGLAWSAVFTPRASASANRIDVKGYGAVGDGKSHPACAFLHLANVAALRSYKGGTYNFATSCSNEMDWLAVTAAIAAGHDVQYPEGTFVNDQTITLPPADSVNNGSISISIFGVSHNRSVLYWPMDLGRGHAAVACASRATNSCSGRIDHLSLKGPGSWHGFGRPVASMDGIYWGPRRLVNDLFIQDFNKCFSVVGDQTEIDQLYTDTCTYGVYFDIPSKTNFGDMLFNKTIIDRSSRAGIGLAPNTVMIEITWISLIVGGAPWGILKEFGGSTRPAEITHGSTFISTQFEHIGNGLIGDDNLGDTRLGIDYNTRWLQTEFMWNSKYKLPNTEPDGIFNLFQSYLTIIDGIREPGLWQPGRFAIFNIRFPTQSKIIGDLPALLHNAVRKGVPLSRYGSDSWMAETPGLPPQPVSSLQNSEK